MDSPIDGGGEQALTAAEPSRPKKFSRVLRKLDAEKFANPPHPIALGAQWVQPVVTILAVTVAAAGFWVSTMSLRTAEQAASANRESLKIGLRASRGVRGTDYHRFGELRRHAVL